MISSVESAVRARPRRWVVTGAAGFIGSNLVERLLALGQTVVGVDDFSTGHRGNIDAVAGDAAGRFDLVEGDICDPEVCRAACGDADIVLHQAALVSVPKSIEDPVSANRINVTGFVQLLQAAHVAGVERVVYASSCAVYGDHPALPKREDGPTRPQSPYAASKLMNEQWAASFEGSHGLRCVGLRYFNVFGRRQDPAGAYAAVIPRWIAALLGGEQAVIYGDGESSRDFVHVDDVVTANLLAALGPGGTGAAYNVGSGRPTTLNALYAGIREAVSALRPDAGDRPPRHEEYRRGDIRHSHADIAQARAALGFSPAADFSRAVADTVAWYASHAGARV